MTISINRRRAEELILKTYSQFSEPLVQLYELSHSSDTEEAKEIQRIYQKYIDAIGIIPTQRELTKPIGSNIKDELKMVSPEIITEMLLECQHLAGLYNLTVINEIPISFMVDGSQRRWVDNGDGTFTALQGATLWELYGTEWQEKSGYEGDPAKLQVGIVVGKNNTIVNEFDTMIGPYIKEKVDEETYNKYREFVVEKLAFPARRITYQEADEFLEEIGLEINELDPQSEDMEADFALAGFSHAWEGSDVHKRIAEQYRLQHDGADSVLTNSISIKTILDRYAEVHNVPNQGDVLDDWELRKRPDITNVGKSHIYEIKPNNPRGRNAAAKDLSVYLCILNKALMPIGKVIEPGPINEPGANGTVHTLKNTYKYEANTEGIILYSKVERQNEPQPETVPVPVPLGVPKDVIEELKPAFVTSFSMSIAWLFGRMLQRLSPGLLFLQFMPIMPSNSYGIYDPYGSI